MDKDRAKEEHGQNDGVKVPPPTNGLRRSSRLRNQLRPPPPLRESGSSDVRKRPRQQKEEKGPPAVKESEPPTALQKFLRNSLALTNMFEVCPPLDLAKFRLVCKDWRDLSLKTWRKSSTLKLERNGANRETFIIGGTLLNKFVEYLQDSKNDCKVKPFHRIKLKRWTIGERNEQVDRFWTLTGNNLTSLDLGYCHFADADEFWKLAYIICPNLTRLCLRFCSFNSRHYGDPSGEPQQEYKEPVRWKHGHLKCLVISCSQLPIHWLELFSHFESLISLEVNGWDYSDSDIESLTNAIRVVRKQDGNKLQLRHLDLPPFRISHDRESYDKFALLQELNLPLKSLAVSVHPRLDKEVVSDILELHSGTLESIRLEDYGRAGIEGKFPCPVQLNKLRKLDIVNGLFGSIEILKSSPNLQSLYIYSKDDQADRLDNLFDTLEDWQANHSVAMLPKLTSLTYHGCFGQRKNLITLAKLMPNVEELDITLTDDEFPTICENWKGLKGLIIETYKEDDANYLTDKGLTGGSLEIKKPGMKWIHKAVHPNITDLTELRSFSCSSKKLTDISVYHGFLQLPKLMTVILATPIVIPKPHCFGQKARSALKNEGISLQFY